MQRTTPNDPLLDAALAAYTRQVKCAPIVRKDVEKQIVYGVVYAPGEIDSHGEMMLAADIETMAHRFMGRMVEAKGAVIDTEHDNVAIGAYPIESYVETVEGQPWPVGSWILGVKITDPEVWRKVKAGELNGYSFEAMVQKRPVVVEVQMDPDFLGMTDKAEGHDHAFFVEFNEEGRVTGGTTSYDFGHRHTIIAGTATEMAGTGAIKPHAHRLMVF